MFIYNHVRLVSRPGQFSVNGESRFFCSAQPEPKTKNLSGTSTNVVGRYKGRTVQTSDWYKRDNVRLGQSSDYVKTSDKYKRRTGTFVSTFVSLRFVPSDVCAGTTFHYMLIPSIKKCKFIFKSGWFRHKHERISPLTESYPGQCVSKNCF